MDPILARALVRTVSLAALLAVVSTGCAVSKPPEPNVRLAAFEATPSRLCINRGTPTVRVSWRVEGDAIESCMSNLSINGQGIAGNIWADGIPNGRCGTSNYVRETTFSLNDVFGNNIPSNLAISGQLKRQTQAGVFVGSDELASGSTTVATETCAP